MASGKVKWEYNLGGSKQLPPLAKDGIIYVGNNTHYMAIQDLNTHPKVLWSVPLETATVPATSSVKEYPSQKLIVNGTVVKDDLMVTN